MNFEQSSRFGALDTGTVAMVEGRFKYTRFMGQARYRGMPAMADTLHDVIADPDEKRDLVATEPQQAARMRAAIDARLRSHGGAPP
jgi:hypothetical protein